VIAAVPVQAFQESVTRALAAVAVRPLGADGPIAALTVQVTLADWVLTRRAVA
jgi:hypothetical protein